MKVYVVATNVEFTCLVKADSEETAVSAAKALAEQKGIYWIEELEFSAYPIEEYMSDDEDCFQIHIEW